MEQGLVAKKGQACHLLGLCWLPGAEQDAPQAVAHWLVLTRRLHVAHAVLYPHRPLEQRLRGTTA